MFFFRLLWQAKAVLQIVDMSVGVEYTPFSFVDSKNLDHLFH